jgi:large subunit ribosomal protein L35
MPKMKSHRGAAKRFRVTGSGKIVRRRANRAHNNEKKPSTQTRRLKGDVVLTDADTPRIRRMLGR